MSVENQVISQQSVKFLNNTHLSAKPHQDACRVSYMVHYLYCSRLLVAERRQLLLSGKFQGQRDESTKVDKEMAKKDAKELQEVRKINQTADSVDFQIQLLQLKLVMCVAFPLVTVTETVTVTVTLFNNYPPLASPTLR